MLSRYVDPFLRPWQHAAGVLFPLGGSEAGKVDTGDVSPCGRIFPFRVSGSDTHEKLCVWWGWMGRAVVEVDVTVGPFFANGR